MARMPFMQATDERGSENGAVMSTVATIALASRKRAREGADILLFPHSRGAHADMHPCRSVATKWHQ